MTLRPSNRAELAVSLRSANERRSPIGPVDMGGLSRVLQYTPEDMTVTVETGLTLEALQKTLAARGQWLPIDPSHAGTLTVAELISTNASGPRRHGFGTIRDHLIGLEVALADGRLVRSGGKVVKNVAGFDLLKLFVGAHGTLGIVIEATFKLLPLPASEHFVQLRCDSLEDARCVIDLVLDSELMPVVLDCFHLESVSEACVVVLGFAGTYEEVDWQLERAGGFGFMESATLDHERQFWTKNLPAPRRLSVLPSNLTEALHQMRPASFVARAGNGVIYYRGGSTPHPPAAPTKLQRRVKEIFDPNRIFPDLPE